MNVENILRVAEAIEKRSIVGLGFNMENWIDEDLRDVAGHPCGTAACVAGWAFVIDKGTLTADDADSISEVARQFLGLDHGEASYLFMPGNSSEWRDITDTQAVRTLRHLAATGEVNWNLPETTP